MTGSRPATSRFGQSSQGHSRKKSAILHWLTRALALAGGAREMPLRKASVSGKVPPPPIDGECRLYKGGKHGGHTTWFGSLGVCGSGRVRRVDLLTESTITRRSHRSGGR